MTLIKSNTNTELRGLPFGREAGHASYRSLIDQAGRTLNFAGFGDAITADRHADIAISFHYGILSDELKIETFGNAHSETTDSVLSITAPDNEDTFVLTSVNSILYTAGFDALAMFTASFTSQQSNAVVRQEIGPHDEFDGYSIGAINNKLAVRRYREGQIVNEVIQDDFNIDTLDGIGVSEYILLIDTINLYRIQYGYPGIIPTIFEVYGGHSRGWIPFHVIDIANKENELATENPHLPIRARVEVISGTPEKPITLKTGSWFGGRVGGKRELQNQHFFSARRTFITVNGKTEVPVFALRNNIVFNNITNRISFDLSLLSVAVQGVKPVELSLYLNPSLEDEAWNPVSDGLSVVEFDESATSFLGGRFIGSFFLSKEGNLSMNFDIGAIRIYPPEVLLVTALSAGDTDVSLSLRWGENR